MVYFWLIDYFFPLFWSCSSWQYSVILMPSSRQYWKVILLMCVWKKNVFTHLKPWHNMYVSVPNEDPVIQWLLFVSLYIMFSLYHFEHALSRYFSLFDVFTFVISDPFFIYRYFFLRYGFFWLLKAARKLLINRSFDLRLRVVLLEITSHLIFLWLEYSSTFCFQVSQIKSWRVGKTETFSRP